MIFKDCGTCTACCDGWMLANAYGNVFGNGSPCKFLCDKKCSIYNTRPKVCSTYQCAWSQGLFPDWMHPLESNVMISVEFDLDKKQFLKIIELGVVIRKDVLDYIETWVLENNTYYKLVRGEK